MRKRLTVYGNPTTAKPLGCTFKCQDTTMKSFQATEWVFFRNSTSTVIAIKNMYLYNIYYKYSEPYTLTLINAIPTRTQ